MPSMWRGLSFVYQAHDSDFIRFRSVAERYGDVCAAERFAQGAGAPESNDFCKFNVWFWLDRHIERDAPEGFAELFRRLSAYQLLQIRTAYPLAHHVPHAPEYRPFFLAS